MLSSLRGVARWGMGGAVALVGGSYAFDYAESAYWVEKVVLEVALHSKTSTKARPCSA